MNKIDIDKIMRSRLAQTHINLFMILTICVGVILSFSLFFVLKDRTDNRIRTEFMFAANNLAQIVDDTINDSLEVLSFVGSLYEASVSVERSEFAAFTKDILLRYPNIVSLAWMPRVREAERLSYEEQAIKDGLSGFQFTEIDYGQHILKEPVRQEYFPIYYIEPLTKDNQSTVGFDVFTDPARKAAMEAARDSGTMSATKRIKPVSLLSKKGYGFRAFLPIYRNGIPVNTIEDRRQNLAGFYSLLFQIDQTVEMALKRMPPAPIDIYLYDETAEQGERFLYYHSSSTHNVSADFTESELKKKKLTFTRNVEIAGRKWAIVCVPGQRFFTGFRNRQPLMGLIASLIVTVFFGLYIMNTLGQAAKVESLVKKRTSELHKLNEELQTIIDSSPVMIFYKDRENRFIRVNEAMARISGLPKDELEGKSLFDLYPKHAKLYWVNDKEVIETGQPKLNIIEELDTKNGIRWVETHKVPYRDEDGKIIGVIGFSVDITDKKVNEEKMKAHTEVLARINKIMIGRELRMAELKREIAKLKHR